MRDGGDEARAITPTTSTTTRLISYNIMTGGEGRADPIAEVILGQRADVVGIHEADDVDVLRRLAWRLKMDFVVATSDGGRTALFSRHPIIDSANLSVLHGSTMPILDVTVALRGGPRRELTVRVARLLDAAEGERMAGLLGTGRVPQPMVMLMSHEPPLGKRVVDGRIMPGQAPLPPRTFAPVRQLDEVLVRPDVNLVGTWIEQDRLAYYASDHLPAGAEVGVL